jgi:branched-chain amino acid transport system ATP-binding protein
LGKLLEVERLSKSFGGIRAVDGVSMSVEKGELGSIIGPNGAGKSTLFNLLTGHLAPDSGEILFNGRDITYLPPHKVSRLGIGRSFQRVNVFPELTVFQNIQLSLMASHDKGQALFSSASKMYVEETHRLISTVKLSDKEDTPAGSLSYGDQKRLELGIALGVGPELLLLDEPTAGMTPEDTFDFTRFIAALAEEQALTVVFVEHDMDVVFGISDKIRVMDHGAVIATGTPEEIRSNENVQRIYLADDKEQLSEIAETNKTSAEFVDQYETLLSVEGINVFYGLSHILFDLSLDVNTGEAVSILGRNGVGKTTTLRTIIGLARPRTGSIKYKDTEIAGKTAFGIARLGLGFVPEQRLIFPNLSVKENLLIASKSWKEDKFWNLDKIYEIFPILSRREGQSGGTLSGGEQQMLTIARSLMGNPELLLLDEPSEGLAPLIVRTLHAQMSLLREQGISILISEQNSKFALSLSSRAYILEKGRICWTGSSEKLKQEPEIIERYLGI